MYSVTPLSGSGYAELRGGLREVIADPSMAFTFIEDAHETIVRSVLDAMGSQGQGGAIDDLTRYEWGVVHQIVYTATDGLPMMSATLEVDLEPSVYASAISSHGLSDELAAFSGAEAPRALSSAAAGDLGVAVEGWEEAYLVIEQDEG